MLLDRFFDAPAQWTALPCTVSRAAVLIPLYSALIVGLLAPFVRALAWRVPLPLMSWGMALRGAIGAFISTFLAGGIALIALQPRAAGLFGFAFGLALTVLSARRLHDTRGTLLLAYRLKDAATREDAVKALMKRFERYRRGRMPASTHARLASVAVLPLSATDRWTEALTILQGVDLDALDPSNKARHGQALATCLMERGDLEGAAEVLGRIERPAEAAIERWLVALEALSLAVSGNSEAALAIVAEHPDEEGALAASFAVVRAHAMACEGDDEQAKAALREVEDMAGADGLVRATRPVGPATDLARAMLVEAGAASYVGDAPE